jgi:hypothetical protein
VRNDGGPCEVGSLPRELLRPESLRRGSTLIGPEGDEAEEGPLGGVPPASSATVLLGGLGAGVGRVTRGFVDFRRDQV